MSSQQLPDALRLKPMSTADTMTIDTAVLDPITISQSGCKFVLENRGILDVGSHITFSVHPTAAGDGKCFLPVKTGIASVIQRCILKVGTKVLAQTDDFAYYHTMARAFHTNEEKAQKDFVVAGCTDVMEPNNQGTGFYQMESVNYSDANVDEGSIDGSVSLRSSTTECPVFSLKLSQLFPMMKAVQLPLFMMSEPVSIEIVWRKQPDGVASLGQVAVFEDGYADSTAMTVGTENVKFLADYLTYIDEKMEDTARVVNSEEGLIIPYADLVLTNTTIPTLPAPPGAGTVTKQSVVREIALSGQVVRSLLIHDKSSSADFTGELLGQYASTAYRVPDAYNFRINDQLIYSRDVVNEARKSEQLSKVFGTEINCLSSEYSFDPMVNKQVVDHPINNNIISTNTIEGITQRNLQAKMHFEGLDLSLTPINVFGAGTLVGSKPITYSKTITRTSTENTNRELRIFASVEKAFNLRQGLVSVA